MSFLNGGGGGGQNPKAGTSVSRSSSTRSHTSTSPNSNSNSNSTASSTAKSKSKSVAAGTFRPSVNSRQARQQKRRGKHKRKESVLPADLPTIKALAQKCFHCNPKRLEKAAKLWQKGGRQLHDVQCLFNYACCLENGWGVPQDVTAAVANYLQAGRKGHSGALYNLALCHVRGEGTFKDLRQAVGLLKRAAELGHPDANFNAGQILISPEMVPGLLPNPGTGVNVTANSRTHAAAATASGNGTSGGESDARPGSAVKSRATLQAEAAVNFTDAIECFEAASRQGHAKAAHSLGLCYLSGCPGYPPKEEQALEAFERAANLGCVEALIHIGVCYELGQGTNINVPKMICAFKEAGALGNLDALFRLGTCYETGIGTMLPNPKLAFQQYERAAKLGHPEAMVHCGICFESGTGTERNAGAATAWYQRAIQCETPSALALFRLGRLRQRQELVDASLACMREEIREDKIVVKKAVAKTPIKVRKTEEAKPVPGAVSPKAKSKTPDPTPRIVKDTPRSLGADGATHASVNAAVSAATTAATAAGPKYAGEASVASLSNKPTPRRSEEAEAGSKTPKRKSKGPSHSFSSLSRSKSNTGRRRTDYMYKSDVRLGNPPSESVVRTGSCCVQCLCAITFSASNLSSFCPRIPCCDRGLVIYLCVCE